MRVYVCMYVYVCLYDKYTFNDVIVALIDINTIGIYEIMYKLTTLVYSCTYYIMCR